MSLSAQRGGALHEEVTVLIPFQEGGREDWLQQAIGSFDRVKYMVLRNNGELAEALNAGLKAATTEFVLVMGSDDIAAPGFLDHLLSPSWNADVVYPAVLKTDENMDPISGKFWPPPFCPNRLLRHNTIPGVALIRREKALEVGGYRDLPALEDWDLWVRMMQAGARFKPCNEAVLFYRRHANARNTFSQTELDELGKQIVGTPPPVVATFYCQATPATTYVRCQVPARALPGQVIEDFYSIATDDGVELVGHEGTAIFQFPGDKSRAWAVEWLKAQGHRVLVEVDDNYLANHGREIMDRQGWSMKRGDKPHSREGHISIVKAAHGVICSTRWLADRYRKVNPNVYVCPNGVDPTDWVVQDKPDDGVLRICWFASRSHKPDIPLVTRALEWASRQKDVEVHAVGLDPYWRFKYAYSPWFHDLDQYRFHMSYFDVGVAPILETPMGMGRSDLKAVEYGMAGVVPVVSDLDPYHMWTDGENCLKARDAKGFMRAIQHLVKNRDEVKQLAHEANQYVLKNRTAQEQAGLWRQACT